jgi:hypothetical protein
MVREAAALAGRRLRAAFAGAASAPPHGDDVPRERGAGAPADGRDLG